MEQALPPFAHHVAHGQFHETWRWRSLVVALGTRGAAVVFGSLSHEGIIVMGARRSAVVIAAWAINTLAQ